jgi:hypothetical protein
MMIMPLMTVTSRTASEAEQAMREQTGLPRRKLHRRPDGHKDAGKDGEDHNFGRSWSKAELMEKRRIDPNHTPVTFVSQINIPKPTPKAPEMVEVYFGFKGRYDLVQVREDATQEEIEMQGQSFYNGNVALIDWPRSRQCGLGQVRSHRHS